MTLNPKIEKIARTVSNGLGQISLNISGADPAFYKEAEELLTKYFTEVYEAGRLQGLNEALGDIKQLVDLLGEVEPYLSDHGGVSITNAVYISPAEQMRRAADSIEYEQALKAKVKSALSTYRDKIKSLIDNK